MTRTVEQLLASLKKAREAQTTPGTTVRSLEMKMTDGRVLVFSNEQPAPDFPLSTIDAQMLDAVYRNVLDSRAEADLAELKAQGVDPDKPEEDSPTTDE